MSGATLVAAALQAALGREVQALASVVGGDINSAYLAELGDGQRVFAKTNETAPPCLFEEEARALEWLGEPGVIAVPKVLAIATDPVPLLALEYCETEPPRAAFWAKLGRQLAALHSSPAPTYGALPNNYIGTLEQDNGSCNSWMTFYQERRLEPQLRLAIDRGRAPATWAGQFARLFKRLEGILVAPAYPERVHGDLWSGNVLCCRQQPVLIDPAAYAGHGEVDLAMMRLFGGFDERTFSAYREARPGAGDGPAAQEERLALYQLYPLLVHVNLFGAGYAEQVTRRLARFA